MRDPLHYTWWLASRSAGIVGFATLGLVCVLGLTSALRLVSPPTMARLRPYHERLALTGLILLAAHGLLLLGDPWLHPGLAGILVPFTMHYRPLWTGLGILAFYLAAALGLSFYARRRVGARRWRTAHRLAPVAFLMGAVHALGAGTDAASPIVLAVIAGMTGTVVAMAAGRALGPARLRPPEPVRRPLPGPPVEPRPAAVISRTGPAPLWDPGSVD